MIRPILTALLALPLLQVSAKVQTGVSKLAARDHVGEHTGCQKEVVRILLSHTTRREICDGLHENKDEWESDERGQPYLPPSLIRYSVEEVYEACDCLPGNERPKKHKGHNGHKGHKGHKEPKTVTKTIFVPKTETQTKTETDTETEILTKYKTEYKTETKTETKTEKKTDTITKCTKTETDYKTKTETKTVTVTKCPDGEMCIPSGQPCNPNEASKCCSKVCRMSPAPPRCM